MRESARRKLRYREDGSLKWAARYLGDDLHCEGGPAEIWYRPSGSIRSISWYTKGTYPPGIYYVKFNDSGRVMKFRRKLCGSMPTCVQYRKDGSVERAEWHNHKGYRHRYVEPALVSYYPDGAVLSEQWYLLGLRSRPMGLPAIREYYPSGALRAERWFSQSVRHRDGGPAEVLYSEEGQVTHERWYSHGICVKRNLTL